MDGSDEIRDFIGLTRGLCASPGLADLHRETVLSLESLTGNAAMRERIGLDGLHLWTFCSRQKSSSAAVLGKSGHLLVDGFQLDALSYLFQALTRAPDNRSLAVMLPGMLSEAWFVDENVARAEAAMACSVSAFRRFPDAIDCLEPSNALRFQLEVQRSFVLGHEIGHLLLARSSEAERAEREPVMQARLNHAIRHVTKGAKPGQPASERWKLSGEDMRFRDELFCDTIAVEIVEASIDDLKPGSAASAAAFEAIYFTAIALDLLRALKRFTAGGGDSTDAVSDDLLGRDLIRGVNLNLLAQARFDPTRTQVERLVERVRQAHLGDFGLAHVLAAAARPDDPMADEAVADDDRRARLESLYRWQADPAALHEAQIY